MGNSQIQTRKKGSINTTLETHKQRLEKESLNTGVTGKRKY